MNMKAEQKNSRNFILRPVDPKQNTKEKWKAILCDSCFLWLFLAGIGGWFAAFFALKVSTAAFLLAAVPWAVLAAFLFRCEKKIRWIGTGIWGLVLLIAAFLMGNVFVSGKNALLNQMMSAIGKHYPYFLPEYPTKGISGHRLPWGTAVYVWALALLVFLGVYLLKTGNRILLGLFLLAFLAVQPIFGMYAPLFWNLALIGMFLTFWLHSYGTLHMASTRQLAGLETLAGIAVLSGLFFLTAQIWMPVKQYEKNEKVASWKEKILSASAESKYGGDAELLPEGDFRNLGSFIPKGKEALKVTMTQPESYYLRGYTGSVYTGTGWQETDSEKRWAGKDLFFWLHKDGYYGQEALALAAEALGGTDAKSGDTAKNDTAAEEKNTITIENKGGSSKYCYVPYELLDSSNQQLDLGGQKIGDDGLLAAGNKGSRKYTYQALANQVVRYPILAAKLLDEENLTEEGKSYQKKEEYYNEYVYDTYLTVPPSIQNSLSELLGEKDITPGDRHVDYADAKQNILYVLSSEFEYAEKLDANWNGVDFIYEFLNGTKKGYSVHYASAAVMMFRYYGIPARYVEGYLITPDDVKDMQAGQAYELDDSHSHAWVEFYQDGIGWLPFEVTPSYLNVMQHAEDFQDISGVAGENNQEDTQTQDEDQEEDGNEADSLDWFLIIEIILIVILCLLVLLFLAFLVWLFLKRRQSKKSQEEFKSEDLRLAIRSLFNYSMNILGVSGLRVRNTSLYRYEKQIGKMFDEDTKAAYREIVNIRQEAVYSLHDLTEEQRDVLVKFKNEVWERVYKNGSRIQRLQLKYVYFL